MDALRTLWRLLSGGVFPRKGYYSRRALRCQFDEHTWATAGIEPIDGHLEAAYEDSVNGGLDVEECA